MADEPEGIEYPREMRVPPIIEARPRNWWTWGVLGLIFALLIGGSLAQNFSPDHEEAAAGENDLLQVKVLVGMGSVLKDLSDAAGPSGGSTLAKNEKQTKDGYRQIADKLAQAKNIEPEDARLILAMNQEAGDKPNQKALDVLTNSKKESDQNVATIYQSPTLEPGDVERFAPKGQDFVDRLIRAQANEKAGVKGARKGLINTGALGGLLVFGLAAMGALAIGSVVLLLHFVAVSRGAKPKGLPVPWMTKASGDRFALRMAIYLASFVGMSVISLLVRKAGVNLEPIVGQTVGLLFVAIVVVAMLSTPVLGAVDSWKKVAGSKPAGGVLGPALAGWMANAPVILLMMVVSSVLIKILPTPTHPVQAEIASTTNPLSLGMIFLTASVLAPFIEETTFRGLLFPAISAISGKPWVGMLVSGFLFAAIHPQGPALWPALAGLGVLMAYLTYWTGSIVPGMIFHGLHNGAILLISVLINSI